MNIVFVIPYCYEWVFNQKTICLHFIVTYRRRERVRFYSLNFHLYGQKHKDTLKVCNLNVSLLNHINKNDNLHILQILHCPVYNLSNCFFARYGVVAMFHRQEIIITMIP